MSAKRLVAAVAGGMLFAAAGCGGEDGAKPASATTVDESKPFMRADGPLGAVVIVAGQQADGQLKDVRPGYTTADREVNAFIILGAAVEEDSPLTVAWYRHRAGSERQRLFSHEITVGPNGRARSQAVAPGGLAPGIYETVAMLGEWQARTLWIVREPVRAQRALSAVTQSAAESPDVPGPGVASFEGSLWDGPKPGPAPNPPDTCTFTGISIRAIVELQTSVSWVGPCSTVTLAATVAGPPLTLRSVQASEQAGRQVTGTASLCSLPGGSDLPGTVVRVVADDSGGASQTTAETLQDLGPTLHAGLDSVPARGSRVDAGDTIKIEAGALVFEPALGIKVVYVNANDELVEAAGNLSGSDQPRACDEGRMIAALRTQYRVPRNPPPVIEICANAVGFDGTEAPPDCAQFYTGEVWEGTIKSIVISVPPPDAGQGCPEPVHVDGTVRLQVAADGKVTGTYDVTGCAVGEPHGEFKGTATAAGFTFPQLIVQTNGQLVRKVTPKKARRTLLNFQGLGGVGALWTTTWDLDCKSC